MVGLLNLFLDESLGYTWRWASLVVAKSQSQGKSQGVVRARSIRHWVLDFARTQHLPHHKYKWSHSTALEDEDISQDIQLELGEKLKNGLIKASDLVDLVASLKMQDQFKLAGINKPSISEHTAHRWLGRLGWQYGKQQNGMYVDGHERKDDIQYRNTFVQCFKQYERHFHLWDDDGKELPPPSGFPVPGALAISNLSLSHTTSQHSFKMTNAKFVGIARGLARLQNQRGRASPL